ncbi:MAG: LapA family protein [Pseudomonadota bacterium]
MIWVFLLFVLMTFSYFNWKPVEVTLWGEIIWSTRLPAVIIIAFLLGLVPMWLYHRGIKWSLSRRIRSLENSIKSTALARRPETSSEHKPVDKHADTPVDKQVDRPVEKTAAASPSNDPLAPSASAEWK